MRASPSVWLALDIGGTKLAAGLVSTDGDLLRREAAPTGSSQDAEDLAARLVGLGRRVAGAERLSGVGVGCGGPMQWRDGLVSPVNIPAWRDFPLRDRLASAWPGLPVRLHNDAVAMAAGEHWRGAGRDALSLLAVVVSTGVGGGILTHDAGRPRLLAGPTGNAGHVGHVVVDASGPRCGCGGRGCLEAVARGPATVAWAVGRGWRPATGEPDGASLTAAARDGEPVALAALTRAGRALGLALASTAHLLDLDRVVVAGGLAVGAGDLLLDPARSAFERHAVMPFARRCAIVPSPFGHDAGLVGAAALVATDDYWPSGAD